MATTGLDGPFGATPAHAANPPGCVLIGAGIVCDGNPVTPPPGPFAPPLQVGGVLERIVRGSAATAWLPLELEAKAAVAELHQVPNDNRLLAGARDEIRSYMYFRLVDMIDRRKRGQTLSAEDQTAVNASRRRCWRTSNSPRRRRSTNTTTGTPTSATGISHPPGFGFAAYNTGGGCTLTGQIFGGGPQPPTFDQFQAYGAALAYQSYTGSADAGAVIEDLNYGLAFAFSMVGAVDSALTAGAITASSPALANAIVRVAFPNLIPELTKTATAAGSRSS